MALDLKTEKKIDWAKPAGCPDGLEPRQVFAGRSEGPAVGGIELAVARWTKSTRPTRDVLDKLHALRLKGRATPVVLVVELQDGGVLTFGPNPASAPLGPFSTEQAQRLLQVVLDEPTALMARARLAALGQAIDSTTIPGVKNSGLFANHELRVGVPERADWVTACRQSTPLLVERGQHLINGLGFTIGRAGANALVLTGAGPRPEAIAVMLEESETFDSDSPRFSVSPVAYGLKMAEQHGVSWLIMARGSQLRLYPARIDLGVGRKGLAETFFEVDLPQMTSSNAGYLSLIFHATALADGGSTHQIMASSTQYAVALGARLRDKVYDDIVPSLSIAVAQRLIEHGYEMDADGLDLAYQLTLRIFFRMLFQVYAEDRKLLPYGENAKYDRNALKTVAMDLVQNPAQEFDAESSSLWDDLTQVWRVIDSGDKAWSVPAYNGGLFASDPEFNEHGAVITKIRITNDVMGPILKALLLDESDNSELGPIDFRSLSVREFGTIYEGLLESSLGLAEVDLTLDEKNTWLPATEHDEVYAAAGAVYFHNTSGQRKGTGSYFTPSFVVEHLLERSLDPALDSHLARVAALIDIGDQAGASDMFFDFRVADLAMGSGHFLTSAIDHIEAKMAAFLASDGHNIPGVTKELIVLGNAAKAAIGPDAIEPEPSSLLRRQIARRCVYGLDVNPIAVELARVSIWIHTFVRGLPMSSLDHTLVCGNSLTGIGSVDEALDVLVPGRKGQATLFDAPIEDALNAARSVLTDVALMPEIDRKETQAATRAIKKAFKQAENAKLLFDAAVLTRIGRGDLVAGFDPDKIVILAAGDEPQAELAPLKSAHLPVLFPEVFLRENGGFDVLIGNPPWEKLHVEEDAWWAVRFPGLRGLSQKDKNERLAQLKRDRPDLILQCQRDVDAANAARKIIATGPFPGIGEAHIDLFAAFGWRNWQLIRESGLLGVVLPRNALSGSSCEELRRSVLARGAFRNVCFLTNNRQWVFNEVHPQYTVALTVVEKGAVGEIVSFCGPFASRAEFVAGRQTRLSVPVTEFESWTASAAFPLIPDQSSLDVVTAMMSSPRFAELLAPAMTPVQGDVNSTTEKAFYDFDVANPSGDLPVLTGASINAHDPDYGKPYAYATREQIATHLISRARRQAQRSTSVFHGRIVSSLDDLAMARARVAYRRTTRATDSRTSMAALVPPQVLLTEQAPYFATQPGSERLEAFVLGVLNARPFDWLVRRLVELNFSFQLLNAMPFPRYEPHSPGITRVVELSARLAARDGRFAEWADAVGVPVGTVTTPAERAESEAELDALVSSLYGLSRDQIEHVFATFHRGWDHAPRLAAVLRYFVKIEVGS